MYFGSRGINPHTICAAVVETALILGAKKTQILMTDAWYFICADIDWMSVENKLKDVNEHTLFERIAGFPEMGVNCFRWEALTNYFSDATLTSTINGFRRISGNDNDEKEYLSITSSFSEWQRIIGFKYNENA